MLKSACETRRQLTIRLSRIQWNYIFKLRNTRATQLGQPVSYQEVVSEMLDTSMFKILKGGLDR